MGSARRRDRRGTCGESQVLRGKQFGQQITSPRLCIVDKKYLSKDYLYYQDQVAHCWWIGTSNPMIASIGRELPEENK